MSKQLLQEAFSKMRTETEQAEQFIQQGELIKAEEVYLAMLEQEQNYPPALYGLAELANSIEQQDVREDLLRRAIEQLKDTEDRNKKGLVAIWLAELAESLIKQGRQDDARQCINESEKMIKQNLQ